ncbi:MAG: aminotransferase class IV [Candidatus Delongbacteria bacterium]|jgi:4-amino-4-deoxychorismate lyase|nr:aminotransferase class IV [Candidatus Delongbacteria bacterium]
MYQFIESIRIENGNAPLIEYHQHRYNQCLKAHFKHAKPVPLSHIADKYANKQSNWKLRIEYDHKIRNAQCIPYRPRRIKHFRLVYDDQIDYAWKYSNRKAFEKLKSLYHEDEEIIIVKNNLITDSSYANLAFYAAPHWYTPKHPLLKGVMRQYLLDHNSIKTANITPGQLKQFELFCQINAMLDIDATQKYATGDILL